MNRISPTTYVTWRHNSKGVLPQMEAKRFIASAVREAEIMYTL